ncbi:Panacea domain-containing protein [Luteibacter sp. CQ10]|uniref:Panacea domain-containing protein n=1 Tax=Luteibacter sp. CQ10 TaxID=2805821 RepID=UPI0034A256CF
MAKAYSPLAIANAFLERAKRDGRPLSNMKLQKLLYFAQGHSHALRKGRLIDADPEAWDYGPVYRTVWNEFRDRGSSPIDRLAVGMDEGAYIFAEPGETFDPMPTPKGEQVNSFLDAVWKAYGDKSALHLSDLSHVRGGPWDVTRKKTGGARGAKIPDELIAKYFVDAREKRMAKRAEEQAADAD